MKRILFRIISIIFIMVIIGAIILYENKDSNRAKVMEIGNDYVIPITLNVNNESRENGSDTPEFTLEQGSGVKLIETKNEFSLIRQNEREGWIPSWYLSEESVGIKIAEEELRVINQDANLYLYPNASSPLFEGHKLEQGKVIRIEAVYQEWLCIDYITYDSPEYDLVWIKKNNTVNFDTKLVKEGYVTEDTPVYREDGSFTGSSIGGPVRIDRMTEDYYFVTGTGGNSGYIRKEDFLFYDLSSFPRQELVTE